MIEEPRKLTIKRTLRRPTDAQIAAFQNVPTGFVADALWGRGSLATEIGPVGDGRDINCVVAGPALTAQNGPADILGTIASLKFIRPGDVLVASVDGHQGCAAAGDRVMGMLKNSGGAGFVTDGPMRDYAGIVGIGLPAWCTGLNPGSPYGEGPGRVGFPVAIGGQQVATGDMIVGDTDGVVVVPFDMIDEVIARIGQVRTLEEELDAEVAKGLKVPPPILEFLDSDDTIYVD
jgi:4-hydroxy-4-methyl-2-oxoglutarate aldolase